jgi:hypothetical protein
MIEAASCPAPFNIPGTSGFYAQMAGVLAGFAFAAIVLLLSPTQNVERETAEKDSRRDLGNENTSESAKITRENNKGILLALLTALWALVLTTLIYSVLAGEPFPQARGRAATEELIDGVPFSLAIMMLFYGLMLLIDNGNISKTAVRLSRGMAFIVTPILAMFYLSSGATDTESARLVIHGALGACVVAGPVPTLGIILTVVLVIILGLSITVGHRIGKLRVFAQVFQDAPPVVIVVVSAVAALLSGFINTRSDNFLMVSWVLDIYLVITTAILAFTGVILSVSGARTLAMK